MEGEEIAKLKWQIANSERRVRRRGRRRVRGSALVVGGFRFLTGAALEEEQNKGEKKILRRLAPLGSEGVVASL